MAHYLSSAYRDISTGDKVYSVKVNGRLVTFTDDDAKPHGISITEFRRSYIKESEYESYIKAQSAARHDNDQVYAQNQTQERDQNDVRSAVEEEPVTETIKVRSESDNTTPISPKKKRR
jgi:hypothetical protein